MDFIYGRRKKDLRHKYFGDIVPPDRIDLPAPKKDDAEDKLIKKILKKGKING